ncbi:MAG: efflux RND transporter periplasmic adaptor subunit [Nannocystaceae bacterium]
MDRAAWTMFGLRPFARPRRRVAALVLGLAAAPLACAGESAGAGDAVKGAEAPAPALVEVAAVREGALLDHWSYLGEVRAYLRAELAVGAAGEVEEVTVREGDRVVRGDLLVAIDTSLATARLKSLRASKRRGAAQLRQARRDAARSSSLGAQIVPEAEIEAERTQAEALQAEVTGLDAQAREARVALDRHRVDAPFAGVVAARAVDPGDWVSAGQNVVDLVATDRAEVLVGVAPALLDYIREGEVATIEGPEGAEVEATIVGIVRALDPKTRTARVRLEPREGAAWLLPGAAVDVVFAVRREGEGVLVPRDALVSGVTQTRVFRDQGGAAEAVVVEVLATAGGDALVRGEGLSVGDRVVVRGNERLRPGQPLKVKAAETGGDAAEPAAATEGPSA